jgi:hypothetical protein
MEHSKHVKEMTAADGGMTHSEVRKAKHAQDRAQKDQTRAVE